MKNTIGFIGLILVLLASNLLVYTRGLNDGKYNYQHSKNFQLTLNSAYAIGLHDGLDIGFNKGYTKGAVDCKAAFLKLSKKQKRKWCK
jgi:hypothetical protein